MSKKIKVNIGGKEVSLTEKQANKLGKSLEKLKETTTKISSSNQNSSSKKNLPPVGKRKCKFINPHGKEVWLDEEQAVAFGPKMKEYKGDQNGNMEPPRDIRKGRYKLGPQGKAVRVD